MANAVPCPMCRALVAPAGGPQHCPRCGYRVPPPAARRPAADPVARPAPPPAPSGRVQAWRLALVAFGAALFLASGAGVAVLVGALDLGARGNASANNFPVDPPPNDPPTEPPPAPPEPPTVSLSDEERAKVRTAIEAGVRYLRERQRPDGRWPHDQHPVGYAALPALTLLECGAPADDPAVLKAADFVRKAAPRLSATYELGLSVLFLDRLGDPNDRKRIRQLALRLIAGQQADGGWTYHCPVLKDGDNDLLLTLLEKTRPTTLKDLGYPTRRYDPEDEDSPPAPSPGPGGAAVPDGPGADGSLPLPQDLPRALRNLTALRPLPKGDAKLPFIGSDNSNTQFAVLALWAAGRHDVPMERTLALLVRRFHTTQNEDGSWSYQPTGQHSRASPSMTCVGLLGLAVGHGLRANLTAPADRAAGAQDRAIQDGLRELGRHVGTPGQGRKGAPPGKRLDLYYLWSVERVAMLYNLSTVGEKDWYAWGAGLLVEAQQPDGHWHGRGYHGSTETIDTCLALLFLKRANLAQDLTKKLRLMIKVRDPGEAR